MTVPRPRPSARPSLPSADELERYERLVVGSGADLLRAHLRALEIAAIEREAAVEIEVANASHQRLYRHLCLLLGTLLASGALALGAYGVAQGANIFSIAALITPISGLAGVFVWGGRTTAPSPRERIARDDGGAGAQA